MTSFRAFLAALATVTACGRAPAVPGGEAQGYALTDTAPWDGGPIGGQRAVLMLGGRVLDAVDPSFGVVTIGDSLLFRPLRRVRGGPPGEFADSLAEYQLYYEGSRVPLARHLPYCDDCFSNPVLLNEALYYWGVHRGG